VENDVMRNPVLYNQSEFLFFTSVVKSGNAKEFFVNYSLSKRVVNLRNKMLSRDIPV
jgi:hypothetical protein